MLLKRTKFNENEKRSLSIWHELKIYKKLLKKDLLLEADLGLRLTCTKITILDYNLRSTILVIISNYWITIKQIIHVF